MTSVSQSLRKSGRLFQIRPTKNQPERSGSQSLRKSGRLFQITVELNMSQGNIGRNPFVNQVVCFGRENHGDDGVSHMSQSLRKSGRLFHRHAYYHHAPVKRRNPFVNQVVCFMLFPCANGVIDLVAIPS